MPQPTRKNTQHNSSGTKLRKIKFGYFTPCTQISTKSSLHEVCAKGQTDLAGQLYIIKLL